MKKATRSRMDGVALYSPPRDEVAIDLSDNTNLWGAPPSALLALSHPGASVATRYPPAYAEELKSELARYVGVAPECIVTGCGSDDVLDCAIRAFGAPGSVIAYPEPTFPMVTTFALLSGLRTAAVPLRDGYRLDASALLAEKADITYLCSPNNPTGAAFSRAEIERVVSEAPGLVIIDEAYAEFSDWSALSLVSGYDRLVIVRTMSKAWGLAGLRVGYGVGAPSAVHGIAKARGPFKVNALGNAAAIAALRADEAWMRGVVGEVRDIRAHLTEQLRAMGLEPLPTDANFVFVPIAGAPSIAARLRQLGVAVRGLPHGIRVTVGPWPTMQTFLEALARCV